MLEVPGAVPRVYMGAMTQKYRPDGFLYWSVAHWPHGHIKNGPVTSGPRTNWDANTCQNDNEEGNFLLPVPT